MLKIKFNLTLCQSCLHTASEIFRPSKKFRSGSIFCVFASVACILIGRDGDKKKQKNSYKNFGLWTMTLNLKKLISCVNALILTPLIEIHDIKDIHRQLSVCEHCIKFPLNYIIFKNVISVISSLFWKYAKVYLFFPMVVTLHYFKINIYKTSHYVLWKNVNQSALKQS